MLTAVLQARPNKAQLSAALAAAGEGEAAAEGGPSSSSAAALAAAAGPVAQAVTSFVDWLCAQLRWGATLYFGSSSPACLSIDA